MTRIQRIALATTALLCSTAGDAAIYTQVSAAGSGSYTDCGLSGLDCHTLLYQTTATFNFDADATDVSGGGATAFLSGNDFFAGNAAFSSPLSGPVGSFLFSVFFSSSIDLSVPGLNYTPHPVSGSLQQVVSCGGGRSECTINGAVDSFSLRTSGTAFGPIGATFRTDISLVPEAAAPEAATWMMMVVGFGAAGFALRRRSALRVSMS